MKEQLKNGKLFIIIDNSDLKQSGVYKVTFNNGCFYFGSSSNFKLRINLFRCQFNNTAGIDNKKLKQAMIESNSAVFEIILNSNNVYEYKSKETELIKFHYTNPLLLNRSFSDINIGVRWTEIEKDKISETMLRKIKSGEIKSTHARKKPRKIVLFNNIGVIAIYESLQVASEAINIPKGTLYDYLNHRFSRYKTVYPDNLMYAEEYHKKYG